MAVLGIYMSEEFISGKTVLFANPGTF